MSAIPVLPETGFLRLRQILGKPKANPPVPAIIPISPSAWWAGVKVGRYPAPIKLSDRVTVWKASDIQALLNQQGRPNAGAPARGPSSSERE